MASDRDGDYRFDTGETMVNGEWVKLHPKSEAAEALAAFHTAIPHEKTGVELAFLRAVLIEEEGGEAQEALRYIAHGEGIGDDKLLEALARELADILYVTYGCADAYGIDLDAAFRAVHKANMQKAGGPRRADGKVMKPEGFVPPDMTASIEKAYLR